MNYLRSLFGLDQDRAKHIVRMIMDYVEKRYREGETDFRKIGHELLEERELPGGLK